MPFVRIFSFFQYAVKSEEIPAGHIAVKSQSNLTLPCGDSIFYIFFREVSDQRAIWERSNSFGEVQVHIKKCSEF